MILVDTSGWVEFLRATGSSAHLTLRRLIEEDQPLATTDVVIMELLAGARSETHAQQLRRFMLGFNHIPVRGFAAFEAGAAVYRACRRRGYTPRAVNDCLIASIALQEGCVVLHHDRDYAGIARCTDLRVHE